MMESVLVAIHNVDPFTLLVWFSVLALCLIGLTGTVVPALPGIPLIFAGCVLAAWAGEFEAIGTFKLVFLGILTVIGFAVDWVAQMMGAKKAGASRYGIAGALVGTVVGLFFGIFGILFMPLIGAVIGELIAKKDLLTAGNIGLATWIGMLIGTAVKVAIAFAMIAVLLFSVLS